MQTGRIAYRSMSIDDSRRGYGATEPLSRSRWPVAAGIVLVLVVLALAILVGLLHLRQHIFIQIANRDGHTLEKVAAVQFATIRPMTNRSARWTIRASRSSWR